MCLRMTSYSNYELEIVPNTNIVMYTWSPEGLMLNKHLDSSSINHIL